MSASQDESERSIANSPSAMNDDGGPAVAEATMISSSANQVARIQKKRRTQSYGTTATTTTTNPTTDISNMRKGHINNDVNDDDNDDDASIATVDQSVVSISNNLFNLEQFEHNQQDNDNSNIDDTSSNDDTSNEEEEIFVQDFTQPEMEIEGIVNVDHVDATTDKPADTVMDNDIATANADTNDAVNDSNNADTITDQDILDTVETLFAEADLETMSAKDIIQGVQNLFQIKLKKDKKALIKERLMQLVNPQSEMEREGTVNANVNHVDATTDKPDTVTNNDIATATDTITDQDILDTVETLFAEADLETMSVKDIIQGVQNLFQIKLKKDKKALIKERLMQLVNYEEEPQEEHQHAKQEESKEQPQEEEQSDYSDNDDESQSHTSTNQKTTTRRPKRTPKKRLPSHIKIHHESLRKRQIQQQKVIQEEMASKQHLEISKHDRKRAEDIAKKFQTDTAELRLVREKERKGLIHLLEQRRLKLILDDDDDGNANGNANGNIEEEEELVVEAGNDGSSSESGEDSDSEEELEIVGITNQLQSNDNSTHQVATTNDKTLTDDHATAVPSPPVPFTKLQQASSPSRKASPKSITAYFATKFKSTTRITVASASTQKVVRNPRAILKKKLKAKQFENGNKWLAR